MFFQYLAAFAAAISVVSATPISNPVSPRASANQAFVTQTTCNGETYTYQQLAGYGFIPSNARDKYGDTIGGIGSAIALDHNAWRKTSDVNYEGIIWTLPDRGWNTEGTLNFQNRVHKFSISLTLMPNASIANPSGPNLHFTYLDTVLFTGPDGTPTTGLDADATGAIAYPNFPDLPVATYEGDGFGGPGSGGNRITVDSEGLVLNGDGTFWVSDEYGPYIYKFSTSGLMEKAIRPPPAYIPQRNGTDSFSADSPPLYNPNLTITPSNTVSGRDNNQGFEGLTVSTDGKTLYALMQSALDQEGGPNDPSRKNTRLIIYDISQHTPVAIHEYVVTLPTYTNAKGKLKVAAQSEMHYLSPTQLLVLARDSGAGHGQSSSTSLYRHIDIIDLSTATDILSAANDATNGTIASPTGVLKPGVTAARYCPFLDFNINSQLERFGVRNGGAQDQFLLNEKWESISVVTTNPGHGSANDGTEYLVFSMSDNDFITQNGFLDFGTFTYADASGYNLDNQALVFQITVPNGVIPVAGED
ncbi:hypothetical protein MMC11_003845 [Xylographa trunciseda]|nr:hypothetical protein [Xylographa trunciseda]